jgi:hypothetical protein
MSGVWDSVITALSGSGGAAGVLVVGRRYLGKWARTEVTAIAVAANDPLVAKLDEQDNKIAVVVTDVANMKLSLATQFGGNGGGMRQAINELQVSVARLEGRVSRPRPYPDGP